MVAIDYQLHDWELVLPSTSDRALQAFLSIDDTAGLVFVWVGGNEWPYCRVSGVYVVRCITTEGGRD